jgi:hypothetical protein
MNATINQPTKSDLKAYLSSGISYAQYKTNMLAELEQLQQSPQQAVQPDYLAINLQRMKRGEKTFRPTAELLSLVKALHHKTYWLVLSEHWCGDAAQNLPALNAVAEASAGKIVLKLLYRDQNLDLIDAFLSNGARAIPRLIQLNSHFGVTALWGPRPNEAQRLVKELKGNPATAETYAEQLHKWYALNKQQAIQGELSILLQRALAFCPECA